MTDALSHSLLLLALFALTMGSTMLLVRGVRALALSKGWVDKPDGERKAHKGNTPTLGGLAIAGGFAVGMLVLYLFSMFTDLGVHIPSGAFLFGALIMLLAGVYDDTRGLGYKRKIIVQLFVAYLMIYAGYRIDLSALPFFGDDPYQHAMLSSTITLLWILGVMNAVNFIDGLDGLAAGVVLIAFLCMAAVFGMHGQFGLVMIAVVMSAALVGFLKYNFNPASIFMGDTGSLFIGFAIAAYSLEAQVHANPLIAILILAVALGVPVMDTALSVLRRIQQRRAIWLPDRDHIHHRLVERYTVPQAVLILYGTAATMGALAIFMAMSTPAIAFSVFGFTLLGSYGGLRLLRYDLFKPFIQSSDSLEEMELSVSDQPARVVVEPEAIGHAGSSGDGCTAPAVPVIRKTGQKSLRRRSAISSTLTPFYAQREIDCEASMITEETIVKASDDLSTAELEGEAVILDVNSGQYYGLNKVGAKILQIVQEPVAVGKVIDGVLHDFDVDRDRLKADVMNFLNEMHGKKLVEIHE